MSQGLIDISAGVDWLASSPEPEHQRLARALERLLTERVDPSVALGLPKQRRGVFRCVATQTRDDLIREAGAIFYPAQSARRLALALARDLARYEALQWPRHRKAKASPHPAATVEEYYWRICRHSGFAPGVETIRKVLGKK